MCICSHAYYTKNEGEKDNLNLFSWAPAHLGIAEFPKAYEFFAVVKFAYDGVLNL
jgi:hypothetical protein